MKPTDMDVEIVEERKMNANFLTTRGLKLIGIRFYPCMSGDGEEVRKSMCMQKNLYGKDWLYFNRGFTIVEEKDESQVSTGISRVEVEENAFDSGFLLYSDSFGVSIGVSAIIGQNGTGKSTIVDTIIRLINNFSAAIIGEDYVYSNAQHLHFIENVYASFAVYIDTKVKILTCLGNRMFLSTYETDIAKSKLDYEGIRDKTLVEVYNLTQTVTILNGTESSTELLPAQDCLKPLLKEWFYTQVSNYSLYAYNYRDFESEWTSDIKLSILQSIRPKDNKAEDKCWLKGVFHKNDGYQTPVVIYPMRHDGYVNASQVNAIGKQNLISLAFVEAKNESEDHFPFRVINKTHHLVGFYFDRHDDALKGFIDGIMSEKFDLDDEQRVRFCRLENPIKEFWANAIGVKYNPSTIRSLEKRAWDYVVYKTIKIFWSYKHYEKAWESLKGNKEQEELQLHLDELIKDGSHRTLKLRRALAFLKYSDDHYLNNDLVVDLDMIYNWMRDKLGEQLYPGRVHHPITIDDLLPPPDYIVNVVLQLVDNEHLEEYKKIGNKSLNIIPFWGLSAGERQIAYTLGNIVYHLRNIESAKQDFNSEPNHLKSLKYEYVNIMLDEVELYFHPDLQRRFVSLLIDAIKGLDLKSIHGINVTLITHSPFVLSDIPAENILCLSRSEDDRLEGKTFAANIHDLFNNTFFLPYTVGELAKKEIESIVRFYNDWRISRHNRDARHKEGETMGETRKREWDKMRYITHVVGDEYLHGELNDMLDEIEEGKADETN